MNIARATLYLRPGEDFILKGPNYSDLEWVASTTRPTEQELQNADLSAAKADKIVRIKDEARQRILATYPDWRQRNCALGFYSAQTSDAIKNGINAIRSSSDAAETAVNALDSVTSVDAFTW